MGVQTVQNVGCVGNLLWPIISTHQIDLGDLVAINSSGQIVLANPAGGAYPVGYAIFPTDNSPVNSLTGDAAQDVVIGFCWTGIVKGARGMTGMTIGAPVYADQVTQGAYTQTQGNASSPIGYATAADTAFINVGGNPVNASPKGVLLTLCTGLTPAGTGGDIAEIVVPYSPLDGVTSVTWNVLAILFRVQTAGGAPEAQVEVSTAATAFSATTVGSVTLASGAYEGVQNSAFTTATVASGNKLRFNAIA